MSLNREAVETIQLTNIGQFGVERVSRPGIPAHLHAGIDIKPPNENYKTEEFIYAIADGVVISKRTDGAYGQLIIEHELEGQFFWTVYEHIADIQVDLYQTVTNQQPLARFFRAQELDEIGWQFNHFHFEVLKIRPLEIKPDPEHPERRFNAYSLTCYEPSDLAKCYYDPTAFIQKMSTY